MNARATSERTLYAPATAPMRIPHKVRKGEVGGFAQYFTAAELSEINALMLSTLDRRIGYV